MVLRMRSCLLLVYAVALIFLTWVCSATMRSPARLLALRVLIRVLDVLVKAARLMYLLITYIRRPTEAAQTLQQRFAVAASHELRTPLTVLQGTMEAALLRRRTSEQYEDILRQAIAETTHLGALLDDLLTLTHTSGKVATSFREAVDLSAVARDAAADARVSAAGKNLTFAVVLTEPLLVRGNTGALRRAVASLLDNAVTYTPPGGTVSVVGRRMRRHALILVYDTGPGIAREHLPHVFELFYRADPARTSGTGHVGLGLTYAATIAQAHGGRLSVTTQVNRGSTFTLSLPLDGCRISPADPLSS